MKIEKLEKFGLAFFCLALTILMMPVVTDAQGRYTDRYTKRDVSNIIRNLEQSSNTFRRDFDRFLDQSSLNGTREEDRLNEIVRNYENSLDRLRREFDRNNTWWQSRNDVSEVMQNARAVNNMMTSLPFARRLDRQWRNMRRDLNKLADTYDLPLLDGSGGGGGGNVPNWAIGTFSARNPQTGGTITLTINRDGNVTINFDGTIAYARMDGDMLINNGVYSRVTRINNGIRTTRTDNGERIDYYSNFGGSGGTGGNVPNWAIGTFSARNPQTGGTITLTINRDGSVVINFDGTINYATMNGNTLINNGVYSRVTRINNGIRTTRTDNGERIDYRRIN